MRYPTGSELPEDLQRLQRRATRLEWITIVYLVSAVTAIYFTLGSSQAMKGAWLEDLLSLAPPIAFLVAARIRHRPPERDHPYGFHRAVEISYLTASLALLFMGFFLIADSVLKLIEGDHPAIGLVEIFGWQVWLGWLMLAALVWSAIPAFILGQLKKPIAAKLHDKVLIADAEMNRADWLTATAAMIGVVGIGVGLWWLDPVAAIVIGADIFRDGAKHSHAAFHDLLDGRPQRYDEKGPHPLPDRVFALVADESWVREAAVRTRDSGHVFNVQVIAVPVDDDDAIDRADELRERITALDWKLQDVVVVLTRELEGVPEGVHVRGRGLTRA